MKKPKIVFWDIETIPNLESVLENWCGMREFMGLKADMSTMICFGYKIQGEKKAKCINAWDFPEWDEDVNNDYNLVQAAYEVLKDADAVVTHNGKNFDYKFLNTRLLYHGFPPLPKIPHIDTCWTGRKQLYLQSNRLNNLAKFTKSELKMGHSGWQLWVDVHHRKKKAMRVMTKYCKQDVEVLEQVFNNLKPYIKNLPNMNLYNGTKQACPTCGGYNLHKHGTRTTKTQIKQRFLCQDCGCTSEVTKDNNKQILRSD